MKCKICGGTGTSNTCVNGTFKPCTFCDGTGEYEPFDADVELDKLYPTEQTNEEWLRSATTEQLIEFLEKITDPHVGYLVGYWEEWLKQPHKPIS